MPNKLLITDLDNTLYDWVTFFTAAFRSMVSELSHILQEHEETLLMEFKAVHQRYGNSEQPFAVLELPSVKRRYPKLSKAAVLQQIDPALHRFNSVRKRTLCLYEGTLDTLTDLRAANVKIVGHTEAILANAFWRLRSLGIEKYFNRLYTLQGREAIHVSSDSRHLDPPDGFVTVVPREERKPNPRLLVDICQQEGVGIESAYYLGDSLIRDVAMAKRAGVTAIWARYGTTSYDPECWAYLVKITHWTDDDVLREKELRNEYQGIEPDYVVDNFNQLKPIILQD